MEGVMMKNKDEYAVAVRKPNNEIAVEKSTYKDLSEKVKLFKLPVFRGMLAFIDSLVIGIKVLNYSTSFFEEEEETEKQKKQKPDKKASAKKDSDFEIEEVSATYMATEEDELSEEKPANISVDEKKDEKSNAILMVFAVLISVMISVTLFMVLPVLLTGFLSKLTDNNYILNAVEAVVRLAIFIGYVLLASRMKEIKRVFMYHGAEHKTINCLENGFELTVENVRWQSKEHKRCGTSFMLLVILISAVFFMIIPTYGILQKVITRVLLVPFIAGFSYEFIRLAGKSESKLVDILSKPGLWMQGLTTKEPDDTMIEVAIASVDAVFDWRTFLGENDAKNTKSAKAGKPAQVAAKGTENREKSAQVAAKGTEKLEKPAQVATKRTEKPEKPVKNTAKAVESKAKPAETDVKPVEKTAKNIEKKQEQGTSMDKKNLKTLAKPTPIMNKSYQEDEEDDEILKALDKFFDDGSKAK